MACCCLPGLLAAGPHAAKYVYYACFVLAALVTWLLRDYAGDILTHVGGLGACLDAPEGQQSTCVGTGAVLRMSFGTFLFFAAHWVALLCCRRDTDPRRFLHTGLLPLQILAWGALIGMSFALPNQTFLVFGQIARVLAGFFLVLQIIILLDFVFAVNEYLIDKETCVPLLVGATVVMYAGALALLGVLYYLYAPAASCGLNIFFITWTLVMALAYTAVSVAPWRAPSGGLLTSGCTFLYCAFVAWGALSSERPDSFCTANGGLGSTGLKVAAFVFALAFLLVSLVRSSQEARTFSTRPEVAEGGEATDGSLPYPYDFFHLMFALATCYLAMVFLSWDLNAAPDKLRLDYGYISAWVKMASQWLCALLYLWMLAAPALLRHRQF